jgi:maltose phosphorylase
MATKDQQVARNLLTYRYNQLDKAIENTKQSRFQNGLPSINGYHEWENAEWEITHEIHRNGAIAFAIF